MDSSVSTSASSIKTEDTSSSDHSRESSVPEHKGTAFIAAGTDPGMHGSDIAHPAPPAEAESAEASGIIAEEQPSASKNSPLLDEGASGGVVQSAAGEEDINERPRLDQQGSQQYTDTAGVEPASAPDPFAISLDEDTRARQRQSTEGSTERSPHSLVTGPAGSIHGGEAHVHWTGQAPHLASSAAAVPTSSATPLLTAAAAGVAVASPSRTSAATPIVPTAARLGDAAETAHAPPAGRAPRTSLQALLDAPSQTQQEAALKDAVRQMIGLIGALEAELAEVRGRGSGARLAAAAAAPTSRKPKRHSGTGEESAHRRRLPLSARTPRGQSTEAHRLAAEPIIPPPRETTPGQRRGRPRQPVREVSARRASGARQGPLAPPHYSAPTYAINQRYRYPSATPSPSQEREARRVYTPPSPSPQPHAPRRVVSTERPPPSSPTRGHAPKLRTASRVEERAAHEAERTSPAATVEATEGPRRSASRAKTPRRTASSQRRGGSAARSRAQPQAPRASSAPKTSDTPLKPPLPPRTSASRGTAPPTHTQAHTESAKGRSHSVPTRQTPQRASSSPQTSSSPGGRGRTQGGRRSTEASPAKPHAHTTSAERPTKKYTKPVDVHLHTADRAAARPPPPPQPSQAPTGTASQPALPPDFQDLEATYWAQSNMVLQQLEKMIRDD